MIKSFSYNQDRAIYSARLLQCINDNIGYFRFFNKERTDEAVQKAFEHALKNPNLSNHDLETEDLTPYIKSLARTILRVTEHSTPYSLYNDDGEVAMVFTKLLEEQDPLEFEHKNRVIDSLGELYLHNKEEFLKLRSLLSCTNPLDVKERIKDDFLRSELMNLCAMFNGRIVFYCISEFLCELDKEQAPTTNEVRKVKLKPADYSGVSKLTTYKWVLTKAGKAIGIDGDTLEMEDGYNLDLAPFKLAKNTGCGVIRIDISGYLSNIEEHVYVEQGVNTPYIEWCRSKFKLTTPGGTSLLGCDRAKFMGLVRKELILNLVSSCINTIIAVSPDYVYVKPTKYTSYSGVVLTTSQGKTFCLPVETVLSVPEKESVRVQSRLVSAG